MYAVFPRHSLRVNLLSLPAFLMMLYLEGLLPTLLLLAAALLHEGGHLWAIRRAGAPIRRVDLLPMGGIIVYDETCCSPAESALIAASGAGANLIAMACTLPWVSLSPYLLFFALANGFLAFLNLLPWEALDGGKLLFCLLLSRTDPVRAEALCKWMSRGTGVFLALFFALLGVASAFPLWHLLLSVMLLITAFR